MNHLRNAEWMKKRGHDVLVLCVRDTPIDAQVKSMNLPVHYIEKHKKYYDFKRARSLAAVLSEEGITHLLIRSTEDVSITANVKRKIGDKIHTSYFMEMQIGVKKTNPLHTLRYKYIDLWSCPLEWLKTQVETMTRYKNKLVLIPSGLELSQFQNLPSQEDSRDILELPHSVTIFGLIGRFDQQKGQHLLLEAMTICGHKDFQVALLGEPTRNEGEAYFEHMQRIIETNDLNNRVHLRPYRKDAETFYNSIDWLVMATKSESIGMVTMEALACGRPVLGSNAGGTPDILKGGQGGQLFETLNPHDLAEKIDEIMEQKKTFNSQQLKQIASVYDHNTVCSAVEKALKLS